MKYPNGFYQMDSRIFDRGLKPIAFTVYNYLVSCAGSRRSCFPSVRTIAGKCSCSESAARDAVKQLEALGLIRKEYSYRENRYGVRQQTKGASAGAGQLPRRAGWPHGLRELPRRLPPGSQAHHGGHPGGKNP